MCANETVPNNSELTISWNLKLGTTQYPLGIKFCWYCWLCCCPWLSQRASVCLVGLVHLEETRCYCINDQLLCMKIIPQVCSCCSKLFWRYNAHLDQDNKILYELMIMLMKWGPLELYLKFYQVKPKHHLAGPSLAVISFGIWTWISLAKPDAWRMVVKEF